MGELISLMGLLELAAARERDACSTRAPRRLGALVKHEEVALHRNLLCAEYDGCLDDALRYAWPSWTCRRCARFSLQRAARALELAHGAEQRLE